MIVIVLLYGIIILVGGIIGHLKAGSRASLICGLLFGLLLLAAAWGMFKNKRWGEYLALIVSAILIAFFAFRYLNTSHFMPAGLLSLVSLGVFVALIFTRFRHKT